MKQQGVVTNVLNNHNAMVLVTRHSSCDSCNACKMGREDKTIEIEAINRINAREGQTVSIDQEHQNVLKAAFILYVIPLIALLIGITLSMNLLSLFSLSTHNELISAGIGFSLMAIVFWLIRLNEEKFKAKDEFVPVITEIIEEEGA